MLIDELQDWYRNNGKGELQIGEVQASFFRGFPNVGFTINDIYQTSFDTILDRKSSVSIEKAQVTVTAKDLLKGELKFRSINIENAEIYSEVISEKLLSQYIRLKTERQSKKSDGLQLPDWLAQRTNFNLRDIKFISKDSMLNKYFDLRLKNANGSILKKDHIITGKLDFIVKVNDLGFNTKKGSYINGAVVSGKPEFILDQTTNILNLNEFLLEIGSQEYITNATFDFNAANSYRFSLRNDETNFQELKSFLPDSIAAKLSAYKLSGPIATDLSLEGEFSYGNVPIIDGEFTTFNNFGSLKDSLTINKINFNGYITNQLPNKKDSKEQPGQKDIQVFFRDFNAELEDLTITANDSYFQSSEAALNYIKADLEMNGPNATLAKILQNDNFDFKGGNFDLKVKVDGNASQNYDIFNSAEGRFTLQNTRVILKKNNLQLPLEILDISLDERNSRLENLRILLPNSQQLVFKGEIRNISSLLSNNPAIPAVAKVSIASDSLDVNMLIGTATELVSENQKSKNDLKTLHQTFDAIYKKFRPEFSLDLKTVEYNSNTFEDFKGEVQLTDAETVSFSNLSFAYKEAATELGGILKIPKPETNFEEPLFLNAEANSSGPIQVFQDLFNIELVDINSGTYDFSGNVTGNIQRFDQLLKNTSGDLRLLNAKFYYPEGDLDIEFDSLKVLVQQADINLDRFVVEIDDHHPFALSAQIEEFPGFLLDNTANTGKVSLNLDADFINLDKWMETVDSMEFENSNKPAKKRDLAAIFSDIYHFDPEFELSIDTLKYKQLISEDIAARVYFENDSILKLENLGLKFQDSKASIQGKLTARNLRNSDVNKNPFNFEFSAEASGRSKDLNELLQTVNFELQSGNFEFKGNYSGKTEDLKILNSDIYGDLILTKTNVDIAGTDIQVPVENLHLYIENNLATLEKLNVELPGKSSIAITGQIDNFSNFINNDQAIDSHNSSFNIESPYLDNRDIKELIGTRKKDSTNSKSFEIQNLKEILSNINNSYFPSAKILIDSLVYNNLAVSDFKADVGFDDSGDINIQDTQLNYYEGSARLELKGGLRVSNNLPVKIKVKIEDIALGNLVQDLNYFKNDDLRKAEKLSGLLDLDLNVNAALDEQGDLKMSSLNGTAQINLTDLALFDFEPIVEGVVLLKEERFEKLRFQPVKQEFDIRNGKITIPRTQIQSTAIQAFVEGEMKPGEYYDLWISVPWSNIFKSRDGIELPDKISFEKSGAKFYLQLIQDKDSEKSKEQKLRTKFRLSNRKLRKNRDN